MAYTLVGNSPHAAMVRRYVVDSYDDIATIKNISQLLPGSTAFEIPTSKTYMMKHDRTWVEIVTGSSSGGSGGGSSSSDTIYDGGDEDDPDSGSIIYNGGDEDG